jgi:PTS system cellobiose-specific IIB component
MADKVIALVCSAAMSSSLVAAKMQKSADASGKNYEVYSRSVADVDKILAGAVKPNILLVSPQVRYMAPDITKKAAAAGVPVDVIQPQHYAMYPDKIITEAEKKMT